MGFNQENIPTIYKDDKYLTDKLLIDLGLEDSNMKNKREKEQILKIIKSIKNLTITYKKKSSFNIYYFYFIFVSFIIYISIFKFIN